MLTFIPPIKQLKRITLLLILIFTFNYCSKDEEIPVKESEEYGFLTLNIALEIEELSTSSRVAEVNTDNFIVTIHNANDGSEVMRFDPFLDAPAEILLPTGEYIVRATNLEPPASAAFDQPYYFGESEIFNIDKEELKAIDVNCTLANYKVSFVFSQNVIDNFTLWNATATRISDDAGLFWFEDLLPAEGYFTIGSALDISVYLEYTKVFTGELITRTFETTIDDPQPATHYRINVDASLEDGKIVLNINVDDSFDVIDIDLGDGGEEQPEEDSPPVDIDGNEYETVQIGDQVWMKENLKVTQLNDGTPIPKTFGIDWINSTTPSYGIYNNAASSIYGNFYNWQAIETGQLCPIGWHVPSLTDMMTLADNLGGANVAGGKLKAVDANWNDPNTGATNESGFNGLSSGFRFAHNGSDAGLGTHAYFWSSTQRDDGEIFYFSLSAFGEGMGFGNWLAGNGVSVRCLKD